jgi:hypothetical protein
MTNSAGIIPAFRGYDLYAGHYGRDIFAAVNDGHACITNFRHPVTRLVSLYKFFRGVNLSPEELGSDRFYAVWFARSVSLAKFVGSHDPRVEVYVRNWHFRQLVHSCWSLQTTAQLEDACRFIDAMPWHYVCEYPEMSVRWMRWAFKWDIDQMPRMNGTRDQGGPAVQLDTVDDDAFEIVCRKNDLDLALYRYAIDRFLIRANGHQRTRIG